MEELVAKRVAEELERRKDEIEAEVLRRVEEAKMVGNSIVKIFLSYIVCSVCVVLLYIILIQMSV